jgi:hypothetical protein
MDEDKLLAIIFLGLIVFLLFMGFVSIYVPYLES